MLDRWFLEEGGRRKEVDAWSQSNGWMDGSNLCETLCIVFCLFAFKSI